ncbi:uncharacterized protein LOC111099125 isoform X3 [Crassostrea virginica]
MYGSTNALSPMKRLGIDSDTESANSTGSSDFKKDVSRSSQQLHNICPIPAVSPMEDSEMSPAFCKNTGCIVSQETEKHGVWLQEVKEEPCPSQRNYQLSSVKETSLANSFEVAVGVLEDITSNIDSDDELEPGISVTLEPNNMCDLKEMTLEEQVFGEEEFYPGEIKNETEDINVDSGPGVTKINHPKDLRLLTEGQTCLVYESCLLKLASTTVSKICRVKGCNSTVTQRTENVGSALYIYWECQQKHEAYRWCSQPVFDRNLHGGDLQIASSLLCSGNNFSKLALFAKFLKLHFLDKDAYSNLQEKYLVPTIDSFWKENQNKVVESLKGENVVALGNGDVDSLGHGVECGTCVMMDVNSKKIMSLVTMEKKEMDKESSAENCFVKAMNDLLEKDVYVEEVVTNAHMHLGSAMKKVFPNIKHSKDVWQAAKNLAKKLVKAGQSEDCRALLDWSSYVVNHFWQSCCYASDLDNFLEIWCGIVHHVVNEHEWGISYSSSDSGACQCIHWPLKDEPVRWMEKDSLSHKTLIKIVLNKNFLQAIPYYINFRSTAELENLENLIQMYCGKGFDYSQPVYQVRCQLAALDHNANVDREAKRNSDGTVQQCRTFNKKSGRWHVSPVKVEKSYQHVSLLMGRITEARLNDS